MYLSKNPVDWKEVTEIEPVGGGKGCRLINTRNNKKTHQAKSPVIFKTPTEKEER